MLFVAYGHKLYSHTHSYIHYAFIKAFQKLGYDTKWVDDNDKIDPLSYPSGTVFLTEGQVDKKIPKRKDCLYILHHVSREAYQDIPKHNKVFLDMYTQNIIENVIQISEVSFYNPTGDTLHSVWATDLLPDEIDIEEAIRTFDNKKKAVVFIGTLTNCNRFGNYNQIMPFVKEAQKDEYEWIHPPNPIDHNTQKSLISSCLLAPAITGFWQQDVGYIPCRIFKTISYGCIGITNSKYVTDIIKNDCVYHQDSIELYKKTKEFLQQPNDIIKDILRRQMTNVKMNHTYINRIDDILKVFEIKKQQV
jgi:hypothetical protein